MARVGRTLNILRSVAIPCGTTKDPRETKRRMREHSWERNPMLNGRQNASNFAKPVVSPLLPTSSRLLLLCRSFLHLHLLLPPSFFSFTTTVSLSLLSDLSFCLFLHRAQIQSRFGRGGRLWSRGRRLERDRHRRNEREGRACERFGERKRTCVHVSALGCEATTWTNNPDASEGRPGGARREVKSMNDFAAIATRREDFTVASFSRALSLFSSDYIYIPLLSYFFSLRSFFFFFFFFLQESSPPLLWYRVFLFFSIIWTS